MWCQEKKECRALDSCLGYQQSILHSPIVQAPWVSKLIGYTNLPISLTEPAREGLAPRDYLPIIMSATYIQTTLFLFAVELSVTVSSSPNTVTISWALFDGAFTISYSNTNTDCFTDSSIISDIAGSETMYTLTGLEEGTEYSITVTATPTGGGVTEQQNITATTIAAGESTSQSSRSLLFSLTAPSAPPSSVRVSVENSTAITVQWGPVEPCNQQNGAITGYSVRYGDVGTSQGERSVEMASLPGATRTVVSGLIKETVYTVEVAAETSGGTGVYSELLTIIISDSECVFLCNTTLLTAQGVHFNINVT